MPEQSKASPARRDLAHRIARHLKATGMTQTEAARRMKDHASQVSLVCSGKLKGFSLERLASMLASLGFTVVITVEHAPAGQRGRVVIR